MKGEFMALTPEEKKWLRKVIVGREAPTTVEYLAEIATMTDEEVRVLIASFKANKIRNLNLQKANIEAEILKFS
jgi:hypothetical protein